MGNTEGIGVGNTEDIGTGNTEDIGTGKIESIGTGKIESIGTGNTEGTGVGNTEGIGVGNIEGVGVRNTEESAEEYVEGKTGSHFTFEVGEVEMGNLRREHSRAYRQAQSARSANSQDHHRAVLCPEETLQVRQAPAKFQARRASGKVWPLWRQNPAARSRLHNHTR